MEILKKDKDIQEYFDHAIQNNDVELEVIFGLRPEDNPIDKVLFLKLLNTLRNDFNFISETVNLDIRTRTKNHSSDLRCSILDLDSIIKYCSTNSLEGLSNIKFINKTRYVKIKNNKIVNSDYNYRTTVKSEDELEYNDEQIESYNKEQNIKDKYYRYKKRYSFETPDKLFRIDLSVIKSNTVIKNIEKINEQGNKINKKVYNIEWGKSFKDADILNRPEIFELEIEYIGSSIKKDNGVYLINDYYNKIKSGIEDPSLDSGSLSDPLLLKSDGPLPGKGAEQPFMEYPILDKPDKKKTFKDKIMGKNVRLNDPSSMEDIDDETLITVIGYNENYEDTGDKYVQLNILSSSSERDKLILKLDKIYPERNDKDFTPLDLPPLKRKPYLEIIKKLRSLDDKNAWVPLDEIHSKYFDMDELITEIYMEQFGGGKSEDKSEDKELNFSKEKKDILIDKCIDILNKHLLYLLEIIHNTKLILTYSRKKEIKNRYKKLTKQKYLKFMAPQPVTLNYENLLLKSNVNIIKGYAVTDKADGIRCLLFIYEHTGYLITSKMEIIHTGLQFPNINGEWLLDGEYITKNKEGGDIKLYMIFDIYYSGNKTPAPIHNYNWINNKGKISRSNELDNFEKLLKTLHKNPLEHIRIGIKKYKYGAKVLSDPDVDIKKFNRECRSIFQECKKILDRKDSYEYYTDGLILMPIYLGVKGDKIDRSPKYIGGQWDYNFKWKPPEENTIDFKVNIEKIGDSKKDKVYTFNDENGILQKYKKLHIINQYNEEEDLSLDFCMKLLLNDKPSTNKTKIFQPPGSDENISSTNVLLKDNKILCERDDSEVRDGDIIEMRYNKDGLNGMVWELLRARHDKTVPNYKKTSDNVWKTITNPITHEMITSVKPYETYNKITKHLLENIEGDTGYYISSSRSSETKILTSLHNYIKTILIGGVCSSLNKHIQCLDMSCGRGGDIDKYMNNENIKFLLGLDINDVNEACRRYFIKQYKTKGLFIQSDTSKDIKKNECNMGIKHSEIMINILYGIKSKIPNKYETIYRDYKNISKKGFDVISSQFSLHYYLKDKDTFNGFLTNIKDNINKGGYFIATFYNGNKLYDILQDQDEIEYINGYEDLVYKISKKDINEDFNTYNKSNNSNMFGNTISVYMDSIGQEIDEYLVNMDFLIDSFKEIGLELSTPNIDSEYSSIFSKECLDMPGLGSFENVIEEIPNISKRDEIFKNRYKDSSKIIKDEKLKLLSGLNVYVIFKKV
jgi:hypothetical protein